MVAVMTRQSKFHHSKETTHHWRRNWYLIFVFWPPEYFIVSKRTQLNALKSNSTNTVHRFKKHRPENVKTPWVKLCWEQGRLWDYSWDKGLSQFSLFWWNILLKEASPFLIQSIAWWTWGGNASLVALNGTGIAGEVSIQSMRSVICSILLP